ncbi:3 beta-hydroxysteroid dehydrogenase/Delta 5--_4-isomerase [Rubripirellula amarantea]|uniref:3 beta-hydroxysteroid dehydrogenase/Delta 5-->4-isomerase n=1 Tax=Rubripirellula amarantea TaxID=2527999 RepID=A0A5C5WKN4_9BACT|nr:NAD-dependent epimerase/dehydratase family protein [Rubripirellula amarantea]TWT51356.1 3 beta-hydroxysteroid dehydrogenase/Delta 5-->4-isomerase [Rubripirellula amarantea]
MRIFVTGGTGLLGNNILRLLTESSHELVSFVRSHPHDNESIKAVFEGIETSFAHGDLGDAAFVDQAISQCDAVIHSAGMIHLGWTKLDEAMSVNRDVTRVIVDACIKHKVPLVHIGTVDTLAVGSRKQVADEETPLDHAGGQIECTYVTSKRAGVQEVLNGVERTLQCVIVHPGFMLGPWDWKPSSGRMIVEVSKAWRPIAPSGGASVCDSRDVAAGTISAMQHLMNGSIPNGRQYILAGENWTYFELWRNFAKRNSQRGPIMPAGPAQRWIAQMYGDMASKFSGTENDINSAAVKMSSQFHWHSSKRAHDELGYRIRDPHESIEASIQWLSEHGYLAR